MASKGFDKFINKPDKAGKVKEAFRQEKKAAVRERREAIEKHYEEKRRLKAERMGLKEPNENRSNRGDNKKPYAKKGKPAAGKDFKPAGKKEYKDPKAKPAPAGASKAGSKPPFSKSSPKNKERSFSKPATGTEGRFSRNDAGKKAPGREGTAEKKYAGRSAAGAKPDYKKEYISRQEKNPPVKRDMASSKPTKAIIKDLPKRGPVAQKETPAKKEAKLNFMDLLPEELAMNDEAIGNETDSENVTSDKKKRVNPAEKYKKKEKAPAETTSPGFKPKTASVPEAPADMPLNKYIAHAGLCSRRDAVDIVKSGKVTVNGEVVTEPAFKVTDDAVVKVDGAKIARSRNQVYILLNKPKDYITTSEDPHGRKTVMDIIKNATTERIYPVGRLDRNTSGVLLFTNDGDLAQKLSHPSFEVRKIYEVKLDKILQQDDFEKILNGIQLEDGEVHADSLAYADKDKSVVGIEIHSGKNRVVRRIFEKLGYDVKGLDRVMYANLTKKNVERGKWRFLSEKEVRLLKYFNKSKA